MGWFRSNIRIGARFALLVLALQFALSFGHVHFEALIGNPAWSLLSAGWTGNPPAALPGIPVAPSKDAGFADHCAICANMHLAGSLLPAEPPSWPLPLVSRRERLGTHIDFELAASPRDLFQARAPPLV